MADGRDVDVYAALRERAEHVLVSSSAPVGANDELQRLIDELQVHEVELSMQCEELQRARLELEHSRAEYKALYDEAPVGYFSSTPAGTILRANPTLATLLGTTVADLVGVPFPRFAAPTQRDAFHLHVKELEANGAATCETQLDTATGERLDVRLVSQLKRHPHDAIAELAVTVIDLTAAKRAAELELGGRARRETEQARVNKLEAIGVLAGGIAHDFNNLLTRLLCSVSLARSDPEQADETLAEAEATVRTATALTHQLLTFAKGGSPVKEATALPVLIRDTAAFSLRDSKVRLEVDWADDLWPVHGDEGLLSQVFQNLVINADEAMPAGGVVRIAANNVTLDAQQQPGLPAGDYVHVSVQDHGVGIAEADLATVFDPYSTTKGGSGGLGLTTVFSVIRRHGGRVDITSKLGVGTTVHLHLPALPGASAVEPTPAVLPRAEPANTRILVMDDDEQIRRLLQRALSRRGYHVDTVADGAAAIDAYRASRAADRRYDVVLMDLIIVGGMGGVAAMAELRNLDPSVCAIVMSGYSVDPVLSAPAHYGFRGVLKKPFDPTKLKQAIENALASGT